MTTGLNRTPLLELLLAPTVLDERNRAIRALCAMAAVGTSP
jgi:hypothetical protein